MIVPIIELEIVSIAVWNYPLWARPILSLITYYCENSSGLKKDALSCEDDSRQVFPSDVITVQNAQCHEDTGSDLNIHKIHLHSFAYGASSTSTVDSCRFRRQFYEIIEELRMRRVITHIYDLSWDFLSVIKILDRLAHSKMIKL